MILLVISLGSPGTSRALADEAPSYPPTGEVAAVASALGLTPEEADRALELTADVEALGYAAQAAYPDTFGGIWRDNTQGGRVKLAFTSGASEKAADLAEGFPVPTLVDGVTVASSYAALSTVVDDVTGDFEELRTEGIPLTQVMVDVTTNRVEVGLAHLDSSAEAFMTARYGSELSFVPTGELVPAACTRTSCTGAKLRAGLKLEFPESGLSYCTAAFPTYAYWAGSDPTGILTAGHCGGDTGDLGVEEVVTHGSIILGNVADVQTSGKVDAAWIDRSSLYPQTISNWVWEEYNYFYPITSKAGSGGGTIGDPICHSGVRRGWRCGQITGNHVNMTIRGLGAFTDMKQDNICSGPGDSGAPVYANYRAHGIVNATNAIIDDAGNYRCSDNDPHPVPPRTTYSGIYNIQIALNVTVKTTP
ncbi:MAG: S1 family peptidase [Actinomycetota bacterium]